MEKTSEEEKNPGVEAEEIIENEGDDWLPTNECDSDDDFDINCDKVEQSTTTTLCSSDIEGIAMKSLCSTSTTASEIEDGEIPEDLYNEILQKVIQHSGFVSIKKIIPEYFSY